MPNERKKILLVEDDNTLRNILSDNLSRTYEIAQAGDGEKGLQYAQEFKPDLILLDILLPKLTGLEMLEQLRQNPDSAVANVKVIVFSNFSSNEYILKARVLNVADYIVKANIDIQGIVKKIEETLHS